MCSILWTADGRFLHPSKFNPWIAGVVVVTSSRTGVWELLGFRRVRLLGERAGGKRPWRAAKRGLRALTESFHGRQGPWLSTQLSVWLATKSSVYSG